MPVLSTVDVGNLVFRMNTVYQPDGRCSAVADKEHIQELVDRLRGYTDQVHEAAIAEGLVDDQYVTQWNLDLAAWRERLAGYQAALDAAVFSAGVKSCEEIYPTVVGPLLDGNFAGALSTSGIVNPSVPSGPDIAAPYMLGNQVVVYRDFQQERFTALIDYFMSSAGELIERGAAAVRSAAPSFLILILGGAAVVLGGSYLLKKARSG